MFWAAAGAAFALHQLPSATPVDYPIVLLGTWAHEVIGHCAVAELVGECVKVEIRPNTGGTAWSRTSGPVDRALVAGAGILGPAVLGTLMLIATRRFNLSRATLFALAAALAGTALIWAQDAFTEMVCFTGAGVIGMLGLIGHAQIRSLSAQLIAIFMGVNTVNHGWDYAFVSSFQRDGSEMSSDTGTIAAVIGGSHGFWASAVCVLSGLILIVAFFASSPPENDGRN